MLEEYVYESLEKYGNTIICETKYDELGEEAILKELEEHGYKCTIRVVVNKGINYRDPFTPAPILDRTIIVERMGVNN